MSPVLGLSVAAGELRAVLVEAQGRVRWAATIPYGDPGDLAAAIGRLAADSPRSTRQVRVVLERSVIQLRTVSAVPPLSREAARRYASLEALRLFRTNGVPLVTDGRALKIGPRDRVLWAGAAPEPLVAAVVRGCEEAGLMLESLGPAADVLPHAVADPPAQGELAFPNGSTCELLSLTSGTVWRSRFVGDAGATTPPWVSALTAMGERAALLAAAYAATVRPPLLELVPRETLAARRTTALRQLRRVALAGAALWIAAGATHVGRLAVSARQAEVELRAMGPALDRALALRRDLNAAHAALGTMHAAERSRSRTLALLGDLTAVLGDSVFLATLQMPTDSTLRLAGYAPQAARALARLEAAPWIRQPRFEGPVTRERVGPADQELDRFAIVARIRRTP